MVEAPSKANSEDKKFGSSQIPSHLRTTTFQTWDCSSNPYLHPNWSSKHMLEHEISWLTVIRSWNGNNSCDCSNLRKALMLLAFAFGPPRNRCASVLCWVFLCPLVPAAATGCALLWIWRHYEKEQDQKTPNIGSICRDRISHLFSIFRAEPRVCVLVCKALVYADSRSAQVIVWGM